MSRTDRIGSRLPRFYKSWEKDTLLSVLLQSVSAQLDQADAGIADLMKAHWVDTAEGEDLEKLGVFVGSKRLPDEDDRRFRGRLKRAVDEYRGGGTVSVILERTKELLSAANKGDVKIVENPLADASAEFEVIANDTWQLGSSSTEDEQTSLSLTVAGTGQVSNPQITNMDTGQSITFKGNLKTGEQLVIEESRALLGDEDVTSLVSIPESPKLLRKGSRWRYSEALSERIGVFDTARFNEHTFAVGIPTVKVRFEWTRRQPATFMIQIKSKALRNSGLTESYLQKTVGSLKAAGVKAIIKVTE